MSEKEQINFEWEKIVEKLYEQQEDFDYKKVKHLAKDIKKLQEKSQKRSAEIKNTIEITQFNNQENLKKELQELEEYLNEFTEYLNNFIKLEPTTKQGYYNYLINAISYL